jgi:hypothetical protein
VRDLRLLGLNPTLRRLNNSAMVQPGVCCSRFQLIADAPALPLTVLARPTPV